MSESLDRITELVEQAQGIAGLRREPEDGTPSWELLHGALAPFVSLAHKSDLVSVVDCHMRMGSVFPRHRHLDIRETIHVYRGLVRFAYDDGQVFEIAAGASVTIPPGMWHTATALLSSDMIGVTVPADPGYEPLSPPPLPGDSNGTDGAS